MNPDTIPAWLFAHPAVPEIAMALGAALLLFGGFLLLPALLGLPDPAEAYPHDDEDGGA